MNQDTGYTAGEAARLMDIGPMEVAHLGQIVPPDTPANGRGHKSIYSFRNLVEMRLAEQLATFGVPWKRISRYIENLRKSRGRWLEEGGLDGWLVLDRCWRWGAGTTLEIAVASLSRIPVITMVAINVAAIKRGIRGARAPVSDQEFALALSQVQESKNRIPGEGGGVSTSIS